MNDRITKFFYRYNTILFCVLLITLISVLGMKNIITIVGVSIGVIASSVFFQFYIFEKDTGKLLMGEEFVEIQSITIDDYIECLRSLRRRDLITDEEYDVINSTVKSNRS